MGIEKKAETLVLRSPKNEFKRDTQKDRGQEKQVLRKNKVMMDRMETLSINRIKTIDFEEEIKSSILERSNHSKYQQQEIEEIFRKRILENPQKYHPSQNHKPKKELSL